MADYPSDPNQRSLRGPSSYGIPAYYDRSQSNGYARYGEQEVDSASVEYNRSQGAASFAYNSTFPFFSPATVASGIPPLPIFQNWHPDPFSSVSEQLYQPEISETATAAARPSQSLLNDNGQSSSFNARLPQIVPASIPVDQRVEEGELSEGEFEEANPGSTIINRGGSNFNREINPPNIIQSGQPTDIYGRSLDLSKQRSPSYSPYASPVQSSYGIPPVTQARPYDEYIELTEENVYPNYDNRSGNRGTRSDFVENPNDVLPNVSSMSIPLAGSASARVKSIAPHSTKKKSVREARKEAQSAILNLWPLKVRFQNYIEEGIDEEVVRRQFEDLGMPQGAAHFAQEEENNQSSLITADDAEPLRGKNNWKSSTLTRTQDELHRSSKPASRVVVSESRSENRGEAEKVRVAGLPSEKAVLSAPTAPGAFPVRSTSQDLSAITKSSSTAQLTAKAEKERLLMQKMENLQKSREARARKAASKVVTAPTVPAVNKAISPAPPHIDLSEPPSVVAPSATALPSSSLSLSRSSSPHPIKNPQPIPPPIPGLFLSAGTVGSPMNQVYQNNNPQTLNQRKRPVASDFDTPLSTNPLYKRPFGQNRTEEPLVIDVSDDESEDDEAVPMDIDQPVVSSPAPSGKNAPNTTRTTAIRDLPPLSDFPARRPFIPSSSAVNTPPIPQPAASEDLQTKEMEIQEMKRKIADFERRKKAKQSQSGSQTPSRTDATTASESSAARGSSIPDKLETSAQIQQLLDDTRLNVETNRQKPTEAHAMEQQKADDDKSHDVEQRRLRKARIAADLPVVNAQVLKSQQRLTDLRAEMEILEIAVQKGLADKQKLAEEMEALEHEVEEQPQEPTEKLGDPDHEVLGNVVATPQPLLDGSPGQPISDSRMPLRVAEVTEVTETTESSPLRIVSLASDENLGPMTSIMDAPNTSTLPAPDSEGLCNSTENEKAVSTEIDSVNLVTRSEMLEETALDVSAKEKSDGSVVEAERSAGNDVEMNTPPLHSPEPAESLALTASSMDMKLSQPTDSTDDHGFSDPGDGDSDLYEPHETTPSAAGEPSSVESPPFSPAPPQVESESINTDPQSASISTGHSVNSVFEMPSAPIVSPRARPNENNFESNAVHESRFTPYESVLKQFHSYRFNSSFAREVPGGYKSVTYSNNIKDDQELCRFELAGGVCNDATCGFQHFRTMGLAGAWKNFCKAISLFFIPHLLDDADFGVLTLDDAILVELGNSAGYNDEDKPKFVAGLRTVLQDLRTRKIKDFQVIASEIAAFRAGFSASC